MRERTLETTALSGIGIFSFFGSLGPAIFRWIGWAEWADGLSSLTQIAQSLIINWQAVYFLIFILSTCFLVAININLMRRFRIYLRSKWHRDWNITGADAINYIVQDSVYGASIPMYAQRVDKAAMAFMEHAERGKIKIGGSYAGSTIIKRIKVRELHDLTLVCQTNSRGALQIEALFTHLRDKSGQRDVFDAIFAERSEIRRIWRPKSGH